MKGGTPFIVTVKTLPDVAGGKRAYGFAGLSEGEALQAISTLRRIHTGSDAWPMPLHRITAIAVAGCTGNQYGSFRLGALGQEASSEAELLAELSALLTTAVVQHHNIAVGWQGSEQLWPLLECRALIHGLRMPVSAADAETTWDVAPLFTGPDMGGLSLREFAALCGEPCLAEETQPGIAAQRAAAEVDALLLARLSLRVQATRNLNSQRHTAALRHWAAQPQPAHLAALAQATLQAVPA